MGTRGFITFVIDGEEKTAYNHWDSYPDALGLTVLGWLRDALASDGAATAEAVRSLRAAGRESHPTAEDVKRLSQFSWNAAQHGGDRDLRKGQEWYDLLHETQGKPGLMLEAGIIEDAREFPRDSLFAEWGYVTDFDEKRFEVYRGFQTSRHSQGRFADRAPDGDYYPVALVKSWPFGELPSDEEFNAKFHKDDEDDEDE